METELFAIMFILVILAVIYALVSGTRGHVNRAEEEQFKTFKELLLKETNDEHRRHTAVMVSTLTDIIMIAMLVLIIAIVMIGMTATPA